MSTGLKNGIGIPRGKIATVDSFIACLGVPDNLVDFNAHDDQPCRIFITALSKSSYKRAAFEYIVTYYNKLEK
jgi:mannitol/fructose-specific phosphotransferase system IIA component (Ntr-type)